MEKAFTYQAGFNLGHWFATNHKLINQFGLTPEQHWNNYVTEADFARMAEWGADHVRLPVDYPAFVPDSEPEVFIESTLAYFDRAIAWGKKYGLGVVMDLHHAPGHWIYTPWNENDLLTNPEHQAKFIRIWEFFTRRYLAEGDNLRFDLLNELNCVATEPWNELWQETVAHIRQIDSNRKIYIGGNAANSVYHLKKLALIDDPNVLYTFHMYEPLLFTHQKTGANQARLDWTRDRVIPWPYNYDDHLGYYQMPQPGGQTPVGPGTVFDKEFLRKPILEAVKFREETGREIWMGEYGVVWFADDDSTVRYLNDVADLCIEYGIGRAVYSYRGFARITDPDPIHFSVHDMRMVEAVTRK
ncbi:MAG: cellulase family glycosylhydrolase [Clostridia bacterium]|nr:cellulase family glycosylhydrolase [Clostridia bacterium]